MCKRCGITLILIALLGSIGCPARQGVVRECVNDADCTNDLYCDGNERCVSGQCTAGTAPCGESTTCDETTDACAAACAADSDCSDGLYCNGEENCADAACIAGAAPCSADQLCDESSDACVDAATNVPPFAMNQSAQMAGTAIMMTLTLTASDANGDDLTFTIDSPPAHGAIGEIDNTAEQSASVPYTPEAGFEGEDTFSFSVSDGFVSTGPITFTVGVTAAPTSLTVSFATYLGGRSDDTVRDVAVDREGNIYVVGGTASTDFPVTSGAYQSTFASGGTSVGSAGDHDAFVVKLDSTGQLQWATYLGGPNYDRAYAVEVDDDGLVYVGGRAGNGFPTTAGALQTNFGGDVSVNRLYGEQDGFVSKLSADGSQLIWSTYFGGDDLSFFRDIDIDDQGRVYGIMTRVFRSNPHITPGAYQTAIRGGDDAVVVRLSADGARAEWATYFGGSGDDMQTPSIRVHTTGEVYIWGFTDSTDSPTSSTAFDLTHNGGQDEFLAKLSADGSQLLFGTYLGGSSGEFTETHGLMLDASGNAYVTATTRSTDFPVTTGAFQLTYGGTGGPGTGQGTNYPGDVFVSVISADGSTLMASTYVGGAGGEGAEGIGLDAQGNVYVSGATFSADFPSTGDAYQSALAGSADFFAIKLNPSLTTMVYATFFGGTGIDFGRSSIADPAGHFYVVGHTQSNNFPTLSAAQPNSRGGNNEGAVIKFSPAAP